MSMYNPNEVDQMAESIDQQVQSAKRRPVLFGIVALGIVVFGVWYMTGGSAVGSPHQAEQLILKATTDTPPKPSTAPKTVKACSPGSGAWQPAVAPAQ